MHLKRWITGITALPLLIGIIYLGGIAFSVFIALVSVIALWEYYRIVFHPEQKPILTPITLIGFLSGPVMIFSAYMEQMQLLSGILFLNLLATAFFAILLFRKDETVLQDVFKQALGVIYAPLLLTFIVRIRNSQDGAVWIFFLFCLVFAADIGAFYAGRFLGKHKLCPAVSPGKTIEGGIGGLVFTVIVGLGFQHFFLPDLPLLPTLGLCIGVGIVGPVGDLFESILKRVGNIKDSGSILPGHGGILDRIDAILFVLPVLYGFKELAG